MFENYRKRRNAFLRRHVPRRIQKYTMEFLVAIWAPLSSLRVLFDDPGRTLETLPRPIQDLWAVIALIAGVMIGTGLALRLYGTLMARGLYLLGLAVFAFGLTGLSAFTWQSVIGTTLLLIIGIVFWIRAWDLRQEEEALVQEVLRRNGEGDAALPG